VTKQTGWTLFGLIALLMIGSWIATYVPAIPTDPTPIARQAGGPAVTSATPAPIATSSTVGPTASSPYRGLSLDVGDRGIVGMGKGLTVLGATNDDYVAMLKAMDIQDRQGEMNLLMTGQAFIVKDGTKVLVIDQSGWNSTRQVRILNGPSRGLAGWVGKDPSGRNHGASIWSVPSTE
jgi:hypothetical protein